MAIFHFNAAVNSTPIDDQQIALNAAPGAALGLTAPGAPKPDNQANAALITVETQSCRWRDNGCDPTAALGQLLAPGQTLRYTGDLSKIKFVGMAAGAVLNVTYYNVRRT